MKRFLKILSNILLILNPIMGFGIFACIFTAGWWLLLIPFLIVGIVYNLKFHFYVYSDEHKKYEEWRKEFSKTHDYLGLTWYYEEEVWRNKETGEIKYLF